jgi:fatty-acyl-CoA synthase
MTVEDWGNLTLCEALDRTVERFPDKEAIVFKDRRITFRELKEETVKLAKSLLKAGVKKGDRVGIMMTNCPEWIVARDAAIRIGAIWVPINTRYKVLELEYILQHVGANTLFIVDEAVQINFLGLVNAVCPEINDAEPGKIQSEKLPQLKNVVCLSDQENPGMFRYGDFVESGNDHPDEALSRATAAIAPDEIINITYTSGTTGKPKGVMTSHSQFLKSMGNMAERFGTTEDDCILLPAPLFTNIGNLTGLIQGEMFGAKMALFETFNTGDVLKGIQDEKCSIFTGPPAMYTMIMEHEEFTSERVKSLRTGIIGGAVVTPDKVKEIKAKIGMKLFTAYGMTENSAITTMSGVDDSPDMVANTCGRLLHGDCEMKIVDPETGADLPPDQSGEIRTRGWFVTKGYYQNPEETAESIDKEGWFHTGDLGSVDENGYLKITGRLKDMIISGGLNIDPQEVELLIDRHPAVNSVQAVGIPDHRMGEMVGAFIILNEGSECTEKDIVDFCTDKVGKYKIPKYIRFVKEFPVTAVGKVQKFKLRESAVKELGISDE